MKVVISLFSPFAAKIGPNAIPAFYESIIQKFLSDGNEVFVFSSNSWGINYQKIPELLKSFLVEISPDLCVFFNNTFYDVSSIVSCPIIVYDVDWPQYYSNKDNLKQNIDRYKFIVSQEEAIEILKEEFHAKESNILKIPFFSEMRPEKTELVNNICFIGSKFLTGNSNIFNSVSANLNDKDRFSVGTEIIKLIREDPFMSKELLVSKLNYKFHGIDEFLDIDRIVSAITDYDRVKTLSNVSDLGLSIYGTESWMNDSYNEPNLILSYQSKVIYSLKNNQDVYNSHKIGININHLQARSGFSWRVCDVLASNSCLVTEYKPNIEKYFGNIGIPTFTNPYEAREICIDLLKNENKRLDIVAKSNEIIDKNFRLKNFWYIIEDFVGIKLSGDKSAATYLCTDEFINKNDNTVLNNKIVLLENELWNRTYLIKHYHIIYFRYLYYFFIKCFFHKNKKISSKFEKYKELLLSKKNY